MYSAVALGCPTATMSPRRSTSTPTETMFVARTTSMGHVSGWAGSCTTASSSRMAPMSEDATRLVELPDYEPGALRQPPSFCIAQAAPHVIFDEALGPASSRTMRSSPPGSARVGRHAVLFVKALARGQDGSENPRLHRRHSLPGRADTYVAAPRFHADRALAGKKLSPASRTGGGKTSRRR